MLIKYFRNIRFILWVCLLCIFFALCVPLCEGSTYEYDGCCVYDRKEEDICFYSVENEDERGYFRRVFYLHASSTFLTVVGDGDLAILLRFSVAKNWKIDSVRGICEGENLQITVSDGYILLDGALERGSVDHGEVCLLKITVVKENDTGSIPFYLRWEERQEDFLYVKHKDERISAHTYVYRDIPDLPEEGEVVPSETLSPEVLETTTEEEIVTVGEPSESDPEVEAVSEVTYLGCQETSVQNGQYAVRFLFYGSDCPMIQIEGGGVLYVTVTHPDRVKVWEAGKQTFFCPDPHREMVVCTFYGLLSDRTYTFSIFIDGNVYFETYVWGEYREKTS